MENVGHILPQIRLSSSVCKFVRSTQPVEIFGNVTMPFCSLAIHRPPSKILRRSS